MPGQIQIVTATKSLQMQINQEFQRTLFILNETLMIASMKLFTPLTSVQKNKNSFIAP